MNADYEVDEATFKNMSVEDQNWMQFNTYNRDRHNYEKRFIKIEESYTGLAKYVDRRKNINSTLAGTGGIIGGMTAVGGLILAKVLGWIKL